MPFEIGNQLAVSRRTVENHLRRAAHRNAKALDRACDALIRSAADGETWQERIAAFEVIASRLDGKPRQSSEIAGEAPRELGLNEVLALVLQARAADATDAAPQQSSDPPA